MVDYPYLEEALQALHRSLQVQRPCFLPLVTRYKSVPAKVTISSSQNAVEIRFNNPLIHLRPPAAQLRMASRQSRLQHCSRCHLHSSKWLQGKDACSIASGDSCKEDKTNQLSCPLTCGGCPLWPVPWLMRVPDAQWYTYTVCLLSPVTTTSRLPSPENASATMYLIMHTQMPGMLLKHWRGDGSDG